MESVWKQLINRQISLEEALQLLVDEQGFVNSELLDLEVNRRFRRHFPDNNNLPPVIPLLLWQNQYYLGSTAHLSPEVVRKLSARTGTNINIVTIAERSYRDCSYLQEIDISSINPTRFVNIFKEKAEMADLGTLTEAYLLRTVNPTEQLNIIIAGALHNRVSDIHLEPTPQGVRIRCRVDGILRDIIQPSAGISRRLITALKVKSNMDITESRRPLDGRIRLQYESGQETNLKLDMRVNTFPCVHGEKAVIRLLPQKNPFTSVENLGFTPQALAIYQSWLQQPQGIIIITGPTGSGKTSTLYTSLQAVAQEFVNLITIEDPVEYVLSGITQGQVNQAAGMTFAAGLRAILRQDPDIIMVGEIRDAETAETAVRAALTGHLVFTTLHTNDAISVLPRLEGLGLDPSLLSDALLGIVAQRLIRKVCPHCTEAYDPTEEDLHYLGLTWEQAQPEGWRCGRGCPQCSNSGYWGREAIIELLNVDRTVKYLIREDKLTDMHTYLSQIEFNSFRLAAIDKIMSGLTTVEELRRVLPHSAMDLQTPNLLEATKRRKQDEERELESITGIDIL